MKKIVLRIIVMALTFLNIEYASGVSAQCYRGNHNLMNTTDNRQTDYDFCSEGNTLCYQPVNPNEIIVLLGYDRVGSTNSFHCVSATKTLAYTVYFENDGDLAMATARKVSVTVPLHEKLNYATMGTGSFGFGRHVFAVEGSPLSYQTRIDLRDSLGIFVDWWLAWISSTTSPFPPTRR